MPLPFVEFFLLPLLEPPNPGSLAWPTCTSTGKHPAHSPCTVTLTHSLSHALTHARATHCTWVLSTASFHIRPTHQHPPHPCKCTMVARRTGSSAPGQARGRHPRGAVQRAACGTSHHASTVIQQRPFPTHDVQEHHTARSITCLASHLACRSSTR